MPWFFWIIHQLGMGAGVGVAAPEAPLSSQLNILGLSAGADVLGRTAGRDVINPGGGGVA